MAWGAFWPAVDEDEFLVTRFVDEIDTARLEREHGRTGGDTVDVTGNYAADDANVQELAVYSDAQNEFEGACAVWLDPSGTYDGSALDAFGGFDTYTTSTFRAKAGLHADGFARSYPKEIANSSATTLADGDAVANGDKAINQADGKVWERVAGVWTKLGCVGIHRPDAKADHGIAIDGDYITPALFNEIKAAADALVWLHVLDVGDWYSFGVSAAEVRYGGGFGVGLGLGEANWADAKAAAEADYAAAAVSDTDLTVRLESQARGFYDAAGSMEFYAAITVCRIKLTATAAGTMLLASTTDFFQWVEPADNGQYGFGSTTFDANGVDVLDQAWSLFSSVGPTTDSSRESAWLGQNPNTPDYPTWCADPTGGTNDNRHRGFQREGNSSESITAIIKFNVSGGFTKA